MKISELRLLLQDRRLSVVAEKTGVHYNTLRAIRDNDSANPTARVVDALTEYLCSDKKQ